MSSLDNFPPPQHKRFKVQRERPRATKAVPDFRHQSSVYSQMSGSSFDHDVHDDPDQMEVSRSFTETNSGSFSGHIIGDDESSTDYELKTEIGCTLSPTNSRSTEDESIETDYDVMERIREQEALQRDISNSLRSIQRFGSGLDGNGAQYDVSNLRAICTSNVRKWREMINFVVQLHYDMGTPSLKPNIISLAVEYLAMAANRGNLELVDDVRRNYDVRMALFEAVKYDQGFQMSPSKLFNMNHYDSPMVFSNDAIAYRRMMDQENIPLSMYREDQLTGSRLINMLREKEMDFCMKIDWRFPVSTRYQLLMVYLKRLGFDTKSVISMEYKKVKLEFNNIQNLNQHHTNNQQLSDNTFPDEVVFCFLCRFLLEMTYYQPDFYAVSKKELIVSIIYSALVVALRWKEKFKFNRILQAMNGEEECSWKDLQAMLDGKHPKNDHVINKTISDIIRTARAPHHCFQYCTPVYHQDPDTGTNQHYHHCGCGLNCCLNTYLKYGKIAFCEVSKMPCLSTQNIEIFVETFGDSDSTTMSLNDDALENAPILRTHPTNEAYIQW